MTIYPILNSEKLQISGQEYRELLENLDSVFRVVSGQIRQTENQLESLKLCQKRIEEINLFVTNSFKLIGEN